MNAHVQANALKYKYETIKKEAELNTLRLTNKLKEKDLILLKSKNSRIFFISIMLLVLSIVSFFLYRQNQKNQINSKEKKIEKQLNIITSLQQDIARALDQKSTSNNSLTFDELNNLISDDLTSREFEILELVLEGYGNQEIAEKIFLSVNTIKFHLKKIYAKLDVANRVEIMQLLIKKLTTPWGSLYPTTPVITAPYLDLINF